AARRFRWSGTQDSSSTPSGLSLRQRFFRRPVPSQCDTRADPPRSASLEFRSSCSERCPFGQVALGLVAERIELKKQTCANPTLSSSDRAAPHASRLQKCPPESIRDLWCGSRPNSDTRRYRLRACLPEVGIRSRIERGYAANVSLR